MTTLPDLTDFFAKQAKQVPGGCDSCNAYQTFDVQGPGLVFGTVHHDNWCPVLARYERAGR